MSLVELMVAMLIALLGTIIMFQVFSASEGVKRSATGAGDAQQGGSFSTYILERQLGMAGEGVSHLTNVWGCPLNSWRSGAATVPPATAYPAPFNAITTALGANPLRITPVLIVNGGGANANDGTPDTLIVMSGQHRSIALALQSTAAPGISSKIALTNSVGVAQNDLLFAVDQDPGSGVAQCRIAQAVQAAAAPTLPDVVGVVPNPVDLAGGTYTGPNAFNGYSATVQVTSLGPTPSFTAFALGADSVTSDALLSYDFLQGPGVAPVSIADNVVNLQAVYGVSPSSTTNFPLQWVAPTGAFSAATLMDGSAASRENIGRIRAVRVAVVTRSAQYERDTVSPANWTLLADLGAGAQVTGTLTTTQRQYRYRTFDVTTPLRNMLLMNNS